MPTIPEQVLELLSADHLTHQDEAAVLALGNDAVQTLVSYARGQHPDGRGDLRSRAINVLGSSSDAAHTTLLAGLLASLEEEDRIRALISLGRQGTDAAIASIEQYGRGSGVSDVEFVFAARSIGTSGNGQAVAALGRLRGSRTLEGELLAEFNAIPGSGSGNTGIA
ncbi:MAG: hypothetical protein AAF799_32490 [Myxococcota bacterium]